MIGWLLGKLGLGSATQAVEGVIGIVTQHMKDKEAADELKANLRANAEDGLRRRPQGVGRLAAIGSWRTRRSWCCGWWRSRWRCT